MPLIMLRHIHQKLTEFQKLLEELSPLLAPVVAAVEEALQEAREPVRRAGFGGN